MGFYIYSFLFLLGSTLLGYFVLKFLSKSKEDNLGFWFLFVLTLKTILFYFFLQYILLSFYKFYYEDKIFICGLYMFFVVLEVYFVSKLLKNQN